MLRVSWQDRLTNNDVLLRCGSVNLETVKASRTLRWGGHLSRVDEERLPKIAFYGERTDGTRPVGRPKKKKTAQRPSEECFEELQCGN